MSDPSFQSFPSLSVSLVMTRLPFVDLLRASQVCRAWQQASRADIVQLRSLDLSPFLPLRDARVALALLKRWGEKAVAVNLGYVRLTVETPLVAFVPLLSPLLRVFDVSALASKKQVTDEAIEALVRRCPALTRINVFGCWLLTDRALFAIGASLNALQVLNVGSCSLITDAGVKAVAVPSLLELNLWRVEHVTDAAVTLLAEKCKNLQTLVVSDCKGVSHVGLTNFSAWCRIYF